MLFEKKSNRGSISGETPTITKGKKNSRLQNKISVFAKVIYLSSLFQKIEITTMKTTNKISSLL